MPELAQLAGRLVGPDLSPVVAGTVVLIPEGVGRLPDALVVRASVTGTIVDGELVIAPVVLTNGVTYRITYRGLRTVTGAVKLRDFSARLAPGRTNLVDLQPADPDGGTHVVVDGTIALRAEAAAVRAEAAADRAEAGGAGGGGDGTDLVARAAAAAAQDSARDAVALATGATLAAETASEAAASARTAADTADGRAARASEAAAAADTIARAAYVLPADGVPLADVSPEARAALAGQDGDRGPAPEVAVVEGAIAYRVEGDTDWTPLIPVADLVGAPGPAPELRTTATAIEWRPAGATSWTSVIALADLKGAKGDSVTGQTGPQGPTGNVLVLAAGAAVPTTTAAGTLVVRLAATQ